MVAGPAITLVLVNYNQRRFVAAALESVDAQSYQPARIVLFDDHSTDGSDQLLRDFAARHPERARFVQPSAHLGVPAASFNYALRFLETETWAYLASDDFLHPHCLEALAGRFTRSPCDVVISNVRVVDDVGADVGSHFAFLPEDHEVQRVVLRYQVSSARLMLVRSSTFKELGTFNEKLEVHEDHEMLIRMVLNARVVYCGDAIYYHRRLERGITSTKVTSPERWWQAYREVLSTHYRLSALARRVGWYDALRARFAYWFRSGLWRCNGTLRVVAHLVPRRVVHTLARRITEGRVRVERG